MSDLEDGPRNSKQCKKESVEYSDVHFEVAKTSRAKCCECCKTIEKGETKISKEVNSQNGKVIKSYHPKCALHVQLCEDNRSKCQTCKDKLSIGQMKVKVGSSCKTGPGSKHHYDCIFDKGANKGFEKRMQELLVTLKSGVPELDENATGPKKKKVKTDVVKVTSPDAKSPKPKSKKAVIEEKVDEDEDEEEDDDVDDNDDDEDADDEPYGEEAEESLRSRKSTRTRAKVSYIDDDGGDDE